MFLLQKLNKDILQKTNFRAAIIFLPENVMIPGHLWIPLEEGLYTKHRTFTSHSLIELLPWKVVLSLLLRNMKNRLNEYVRNSRDIVEAGLCNRLCCRNLHV